jgi:DNA-binding response OmpR family regulator
MAIISISTSEFPQNIKHIFDKKAVKLLIIEDEANLRENIITYFNEDGNICESCSDLSGAIDKLSNYDYDCVLLDIGLPDGEGFYILDFLKKNRKDEAVLIISARNSLDDKIKGLNIGADDYLTKPFHLAELKARVASVYRRKASQSNNNLIFNEITINLPGRTVEVNNNAIVISKNAIAEHLWGDEMDMHNNFDFIYTHIKNLRKKLMDAGCTDYLKSIYGIGYKFSAQ